MLISERIHATIEQWQADWKDRLRGWMASWTAKGVEELFDHLEPGVRSQVRDSWNKLREFEGIPQELKTQIDGALEEEGFAWLPLLIGLLVTMAIAPLYGALTSTGQSATYSAQKEFETYRLPPPIIGAIWLRDKEKYAKFWEDLLDQGWNSERVDIAKELTNLIPPLSDMVRFADFSAFDPEVLAKWPEYATCPEWLLAPFKLIGISGEWADKYWFSHFVQPGRYELGELHRRKEITDDDVKLAYRTMGYSGYWQEYLLKLVRAVPTRVDVRRFWDMQTIDETRLREIYHAQGYYDQDLEDYVLWTKVYVAFPDLVSRFKNGWITEDEVKTELIALGMPAERAKEMIETKIKTIEPEAIAEGRNLAKTDIIKGVKKGVIEVSEGMELLQDMNWTEDQAQFIFDVNIAPVDDIPIVVKERDLTKADILNAIKKGVLDISIGRQMLMDDGFDPLETDILIMMKLGLTLPETAPTLAASASPSNFAGFKQMTQHYRKVIGASYTEVSKEVTAANKVLRDAKVALVDAKERMDKESELAPYIKAVQDAEYSYRQLYISWKEQQKKVS